METKESTSLPLEAQHTPGPWTFRKPATLYVGKGIVSGTPEDGLVREDVPAHVVALDKDEEGRKRTRFIADCRGAGLPNEANARLIASAPALLEALRKVTQSIRDFEEIYPQLGSLGLSTRIEFLAAEEAICEAEGKI